jgi:hypothetical protein
MKHRKKEGKHIEKKRKRKKEEEEKEKEKLQ